MARFAKTTTTQRAAAVERILAGQSTIGREARRLKVSKQAIAAYVTKARPNRADPLDAAIQDKPKDAPLLSDDVSSTPRLRRARASAGVDGAGDPPSKPGGAETSEEEAPPAPAPSPEELVALCETIRLLGLRTYAGILGADLEDKRVQACFTLSEGERTALMLSAPHATKYVPMLIGSADVVGACVFAGLFALGMVNASETIRTSARERKAFAAARRVQGSPIGTSTIPPSDGGS